MIKKEVDDEQLAALISEGNKDALTQLIEKYQAPLERYLFRLGVQNHDQEDVLQNTMLKMYLNINSFNPKKGKFSSWIYRIAHNEALSLVKKRSNQALTVDDDSWWGIVESAQNINADTDQQALKSAVLSEVAKLKLKYSEPIILHYIEGKSYQEISYILKIPTSSVGVRINRAKAKLKTSLKKWKGEVYA